MLQEQIYIRIYILANYNTSGIGGSRVDGNLNHYLKLIQDFGLCQKILDFVRPYYIISIHTNTEIFTYILRLTTAEKILVYVRVKKIPIVLGGGFQSIKTYFQIVLIYIRVYVLLL